MFRNPRKSKDPSERSVFRLTPGIFALSTVTVLFLGILLIWGGWRVIQFERLLAENRRQETLEGIADRITASLLRSLSNLQSDLRRASMRSGSQLAWNLSRVGEQLSSDALLLSFGPERVDAYPDSRLAYYPFVPSTGVANGEILRAEILEFRDKDHQAAISLLESLSNSPDSVQQAAAFIRLVRIYSKLGLKKHALRTLDKLIALDSVRIESVPASLLGRYARCTLLNRPAADALSLQNDLSSGVWKVDQASFQFYMRELEDLTGREATIVSTASLHLASVADGLWADWLVARQSGEDLPLVGTSSTAGVSFLTLTFSQPDSLTALVAGPKQLRASLLDRVEPILQEYGLSIRLQDTDDDTLFANETEDWAFQARRNPADTGLPWIVWVGTRNPGRLEDEFGFRRNAILGGVGLVFCLMVISVYSVARATARELEVARLKSDFTAAVSHDFRTPLTSLKQLSEMLADERIKTKEDRVASYQILKSETSRLYRLVENLLDFGRIESGALIYRKELVEMNGLVRGVVEEFQEEVERSGVLIETTFDELELRAQVNPEAFSRALWNLLENAVKYSPDSQTVAVRVEREGQMVAIRVADRGLGIDQKDQPKIFDKFFRGSASLEVPAKGTGLGLTMVREIVQEHAGHIELMSKEGRGSTFSILLPLVD